MTEFSTVAKDAGLSQEAAQKVIGALAPKIAAENAAAFQSYTQGLVAQAKADKEFGGDALDANLAIAKKAIDTFGTPALRTLLDQSGLGNHPEVIRAFLKAGKALSPDTFVPGGVRPPKGDNNAANKLYPKT